RKTDPVNKMAPKYENSIYIFNTETYSWITSFDTIDTSNKTGSNGETKSIDSKNISTNQIILFVVTGVIGIICLSFIVLIYKKYQNKNVKSIPTAGSNINDM
ncbi:25181_t:CDS:1, partial [Cetraspora pellucida]